MKRGILCGDLHCGHYAGLTGRDRTYPVCQKLREETFAKYEQLTRQYKEVDFLICNGDLTDGNGTRSGSTELLEADLFRQAEMASSLLKMFAAKNYYLTYGTPYHVTTDSGEDVERWVAHELNCDITDHLFLDVEGLMIDAKHKVGSSQIPWGKFTATARARYQNMFWNEEGGSQPKSNLILRSHVHYYGYCGGTNWMAATLPALQAASTKFGGRQCEGVVHWGLVYVEIHKGELITWKPEITIIEEAKAKVHTL